MVCGTTALSRPPVELTKLLFVYSNKISTMLYINGQIGSLFPAPEVDDSTIVWWGEEIDRREKDTFLKG